MSDVLPENGGYVAAAYLVFLALLLIYIAIMTVRASRFERDLDDVLRLVEQATEGDPGAAPDAPEPIPVETGGQEGPP